MIRTLSRIVAAVLFAVLVSASPALAQDPITNMVGRLGVPVSRALTADDTDVLFLIKYVGDNANGGTVTVEADGNITLKEGAVGSSAADDTLECPVSGALGGIIDVSNAACDTAGEVVDIINTSTSNWRAVILDGLRTDDTNSSGAGTLKALSETAASTVNGVELVIDTDANTAYTSTIALVPGRTMRDFLSPSSGGSCQGAACKLIENPYKDHRTVLYYGNATSTYGSGTSGLYVYSVKVKNGFASSSPTETVTVLASNVAGGATTVQAIFDDWSQFGLFTGPGEKLVVRLDNSAAIASTQHYQYGVYFPTAKTQ